MPSLIPLTDLARKSINGDALNLSAFPFRMGRESRSSHDIVPAHILERRDGTTPRNNDCYVIDNGRYLQISREHCQIEQDEHGEYALFDRMSTCGTQVFTAKATFNCRGTRVPIHDGDTIVLGRGDSPYRFQFKEYGD